MLPRSLQKEPGPADTLILDFQPPELRPHRSVISSHPACDTWLRLRYLVTAALGNKHTAQSQVLALAL